MSENTTEPGGCPPHYWLIARDGDGERWDCRFCGVVKRPKPKRSAPWGERSCTWTSEERFLAGIAE